MSAPSFVHLRLHSEFSIVDGMVRIDDAVDAAAADGMPALALTDLANVFGLVKFYKAARERGHQADRRLRRVDHARRGTRAPSRLLLAGGPRRLPQAVRLADARLSHESAPRPRRDCAATGSPKAPTG